MKPRNQLLRRIFFHQPTLGQGLVEYALILLFVAIVVIVILVAMGPQIGSVFSATAKGFDVANSSAASPTPCVTRPGVGNIGRCV